MNKKIFYLFSEIFPAGGIQKYSKELLSALSINSYQVFALSFNDREDKAIFSHNVKFQPCGSKITIFKKIKFVCRAFNGITKFKPNILICGHINFSPLCLLLKKFFKLDYIVLTYGIDVWNIRKRSYFSALKEAKAIFTISQFSADKIKSQLSDVEEKIVVLPCVIDEDKFYPEPKKKNLIKKYGLENQKVLLTVARLASTERRKGYDNVIKAMPKVIKEVPDIKYFLVGKGDDIGRIEKLKDSLGLEGRVILTGYVSSDELVDYYNLCDLFIMPSKKEGFGIVFLEALACGKPAIAGSKDASKEALLNGELGVLVDPDNIDEIAEAIVKVLRKEVPQELLDGRYLRKKVLDVYGRKKFTEKVKQFIDNLVQD